MLYRHQKDTQGGGRILTVFLYLNDVIEGGGTEFDMLNITVKPKRGRAVVWPSVRDQSPSKKDKRTKHQALPVIEGMKYGANAVSLCHEIIVRSPRIKDDTNLTTYAFLL
jgi:prolyl 4-hydroxylase